MADDVMEYGSSPGPAPMADDRALVAAAQQDPQAVGKLYDKYYHEVFGYVYHCTLDRSTTEDLTSNVFLAAFRHLGRYRWRQIPFRSWLYRIATNEVRMHYRRRKYDRTVSRQASREVCCAPAADAASAAAEEYRLLHEALRELPWKNRTAIILQYFEGRTIAEIAGITAQKEGTVKSQLHRGLAQLQAILVQRGVLPK